MNKGQNEFYELKIFTEDNALKKKLQDASYNHNQEYSNNTHIDSGFDLFTPSNIVVATRTSEKINLQVKCALVLNYYNSSCPSAFYLYPRSSTGSKTPLRLANSVGIIDSGYRGNIQAVFDNISNKDYSVNQYSRLVQICAPNLKPFMVSIVETEDELGTTKRGYDGFGSTGK